MEDHTGYSLGEVDIKKEVDCDLEVKIEVPPIQTLARLQCHVCYKIMGHRSSLYKHLKYVHKIEPAQRLPISCKEKDCFQSFTFIDPFRRHLAEQHGFNIVVEKYVFQSMTGKLLNKLQFQYLPILAPLENNFFTRVSFCFHPKVFYLKPKNISHKLLKQYLDSELFEKLLRYKNTEEKF